MNQLETLKQVTQLCGIWCAIRTLAAKLFGQESISLKIREFISPIELRFNNSDLVIFLGTFLHGDSDLMGRFSPKVILDLGANIGITALQFHRQFPKAKIYAVEADLANYSLLKKNAESVQNILPIWGVASHLQTNFLLSNPKDLAMSYRFQPTQWKEKDTIPGLTVANLLKEFSAQESVLVKMDIEGAEREIFLACEQWLPQIDAVLVEPHGEGTADIIISALGRHGFEISNIGEKIFGQRRVAS